jgi:hypothetical protein
MARLAWEGIFFDGPVVSVTIICLSFNGKYSWIVPKIPALLDDLYDLIRTRDFNSWGLTATNTID